MNTKASFLYQMNEHRKPLIIYYIIIACLYSLIFISSLPSPGTGPERQLSVEFSGLEASTFIFLFVAGLNSFKENFRMLLQNNVTRKSVWAGRVLASLAVCVLMTVMDRTLILLFKGAASLFSGNIGSISLFEELYPLAAGRLGVPGMLASSFALSLTFNISAAAAGHMISMLFYRLNKAGKALVGAGIPILLFGVLPTLDNSLAVIRWIVRTIDNAYGLTAGKPVHAMLTGMALFLVFSLLSRAMISRAAIKD